MRSSSRRSRSRRSRRRFRTWQDVAYALRRPGAWRIARYAAIGLIALYLLLQLVFFFLGTIGYADVQLNDDRAAVQYSLGLPARSHRPGAPWQKAPPGSPGEAGAGTWAYPTAAGGTIEVGFDESGRVDRISCEQDDIQPFSCPSMFGVDLGMTEPTLKRGFGTPGREQISGGTKLAIYDDLGTTFSLSRFRVYKMELRRERGGVFAVLWRFVRSLVP